MLDYAIISEKGTSKDYMEDTYYINTNTPVANGVFVGVYDGHKGGEASEYVKNNLHKFFFKKIREKEQPDEAFKFAYNKTSEDLKNSLSGTTAVNFYIDAPVLYWANAGDSRLVLIEKSGDVKPLSVEHRPDNPNERKRVKKAGGIISGEYVMKGQYGIQPTRALGDEFFKSVGILAEPSAGQHVLSEEDGWILAGSDGLFDFASDEEISEIIKKHKSAKPAAEELKEFLLKERGGRDNLTFVLLRNDFV